MLCYFEIILLKPKLILMHVLQMMSYVLCFSDDHTDIGNGEYAGPGTGHVYPGPMTLSMPAAIAADSRVNVTFGCRTVDVLVDSGEDNDWLNGIMCCVTRKPPGFFQQHKNRYMIFILIIKKKIFHRESTVRYFNLQCKLLFHDVNILSINLSRHMGKPTICLGENKGRLLNCEADQRLCFRYSDSTVPLSLNPKFQASSFFSVTVQPGLCQTCSETTLLVFPRDGSFIYVPYMEIFYRQTNPQVYRYKYEYIKMAGLRLDKFLFSFIWKYTQICLTLKCIIQFLILRLICCQYLFSDILRYPFKRADLQEHASVISDNCLLKDEQQYR